MKRLLLVISISLLAIGCKSFPYQVVKEYHGSVGAGYIKYLEADDDLDENSKRIRRTTYERMDAALKKMGQ